MVKPSHPRDRQLAGLGDGAPNHIVNDVGRPGDVVGATHDPDSSGIKMPLSTHLSGEWHDCAVAPARPNWPIGHMPSLPDIERRRAAMRRYIEEKDLKVAEWTRRAGVARNVVNNFLNGRSNTITAASLELLARAEGVAVATLLGEQSEKRPAVRDVEILRALKVAAAAGGGFNVTDESDGTPFYFRKAWVEKIFGGDIRNLRVITFRDDSMLPTIRDGDIGVVRLFLTKSEFRPGKVYVLWDGRGLMVKRIETVLGNPPRYRIISDNAALYEPYEVDEIDTHIVGQVIWRGGSL